MCIRDRQEGIWNSAKYTGLDNASNPYLNLLFNTPVIGYTPGFQYFNEYNQDVDWLDYVRQTALTSDNNFSMSGGGEKATYRFSLGYMSDDGTTTVSYTHLRAHETRHDLVCRLLLEKKK